MTVGSEACDDSVVACEVMTDRLGTDRSGEPEPVLIERMGVSRCFGCGQANAEGLRLVFARWPDGTVETRHQAASHHCGLDTVVHGGIQATILDEVMGVAAQLALPEDSSDMACVTAVYRAPVPMASIVVARAMIERIDGRDLYVRGTIVDPDGKALTEATSRWRQLRR
jgi:acyl-coenzyme A thioesterase PaaI-like protein